jgi:dolichol-phosphate mannosyltransferase
VLSLHLASSENVTLHDESMSTTHARPAAGPAAVSIIVPTYNESGRLAELVTAVFGVLRAHGIDGELVVVDDNSPDGTGALADRLATEHRMKVVHRSGKLGLGTAVIAGFGAASSDIVGVMDADLSHPPHVLPRMLDVLLRSNADFVIGSRYTRGGGTDAWSFSRVLMSRFACWLARPVTPVRDATSGFFLLRRNVAEGVQIQAGGFKICLEMLVRGHARHVVEVPYVFVGRTVGESKMNMREATGYLRQLYDLLRFRLSREGHRRGRVYERLGP